jgi:hypothetical protein
MADEKYRIGLAGDHRADAAVTVVPRSLNAIARSAA